MTPINLSPDLTARIDAEGWAALTDEVNDYGCALTQPILTHRECQEIVALYDQSERFRSTIDMERYRFGAGEYRYFKSPFPDIVDKLRHAFYPHLLPIARNWAGKLGRAAPWPDTLDEWLAMCHAAGQTKPTRSCCVTGRAAGTHCTATCMATSSFRCGSSSASTSRASSTPVESSSWWSNACAPSPVEPSPSYSRGMV